jgi:uncharacterized protein YycO
MPSLDQLRPGDVLLVSALAKPLISRAIERVQERAGFDAWHAQWHHAAVYVGNQLICEAELGGVQIASVFKYTAGTHRLRFRRDIHLSELDSCKLALEAALKLGYGYNWRSIMQLVSQAHLGWSGSSGRPKPLSERATICSQLYADAYGIVSASTLDSRAEMGVSPAHLSMNRVLRDIPMTWLSLGMMPTKNPARGGVGMTSLKR